MSAQKLRLAANMMRENNRHDAAAGVNDAKTLVAVADWLDMAAKGSCCDECMVDPSADPWRAQALDVADTYLTPYA